MFPCCSKTVHHATMTQQHGCEGNGITLTITSPDDTRVRPHWVSMHVCVCVRVCVSGRVTHSPWSSRASTPRTVSPWRPWCTHTHAHTPKPRSLHRLLHGSPGTTSTTDPTMVPTPTSTSTSTAVKARCLGSFKGRAVRSFETETFWLLLLLLVHDSACTGPSAR